MTNGIFLTIRTPHIPKVISDPFPPTSNLAINCTAISESARDKGAEICYTWDLLKGSRPNEQSTETREDETKMNKLLIPGSVALGICAVALIVWALATDRQLKRVPESNLSKHPNPSAPGKEKVTGAFGFTLAQRVPAGVKLKTDSDGSRSFEFRAEAPFDEGYCWVDRDGLIYEIEGVPGIVADAELYALKHLTLTSLKEKYGLVHKQYEPAFRTAVQHAEWKIEGKGSLFFGDKERQVMFMDGARFVLWYQDCALRDKEQARLKAEKDAAAKAATAGKL